MGTRTTAKEIPASGGKDEIKDPGKSLVGDKRHCFDTFGVTPSVWYAHLSCHLKISRVSLIATSFEYKKPGSDHAARVAVLVLCCMASSDPPEELIMTPNTCITDTILIL